MKRTMILSMAAAAAIMASPAAFAQDGDVDGKKHHKGRMMEKMDTNNDGAISKNEFMSAHEVKFDRMDADNDGSVTEEEMKAAWAEKKEKWKDRKDKITDDSDDMPDDR